MTRFGNAAENQTALQKYIYPTPFLPPLIEAW